MSDKLILIIGAACGAFLFLLFQTVQIALQVKNGKTSVLDELHKQLPDFINNAETAGFKDGESKLKFVLRLCYGFIGDKTGLPIEKIITKYHDLLVMEIEKMLSTPQKKENK